MAEALGFDVPAGLGEVAQPAPPDSSPDEAPSLPAREDDGVPPRGHQDGMPTED